MADTKTKTFIESITNKNLKQYDIGENKFSIKPFFSVGTIEKISIWNNDENIDDRTFCEKVIIEQLAECESKEELVKGLLEEDLIHLLIFFTNNLSIDEKQFFEFFLKSKNLNSFRTSTVAYTKNSNEKLHKQFSNIFKYSNPLFTGNSKNISKLFSLTDSITRVNEMIPEIKPYTPALDLKQIGKNISVDEFLDELRDVNEKLINIENNCLQCGKNIKDQFQFYKIQLTDKDISYVICSSDCYCKYFDQNPILKDKVTQTFEINRCSAYYKCMELGNLRGHCEREKKVTGNIDLSDNFRMINFCESAQAGTILSTYLIHKTLQEFNRNTDNKLGQLDKCILQLKKENSKQGTITFWLTILVIFLTIVNLGIAIWMSLDKTPKMALEELQYISRQIQTISASK